MAAHPTADLHTGYRAGGDDPGFAALIRFLDAVHDDPTVRAYKSAMRDWLALRPGESIAEIGCGAGHDLVRDAEQVGPDGRVTGFDVHPGMVAETLRRVGDHPAVSAQVADARALPLDDAGVDATRADGTLMYVPEPERAVAEMVRILRPGGRFVAMELDHGATLIDHPDEIFTERVLEAVRAAFPAPRLGRRIRGLLTELGMRESAATIHGIDLPHELFRQIMYPTVRAAADAGDLPAERTAAWLDTLTREVADGRGFTCFTAVVSHAVAPG